MRITNNFWVLRRSFYMFLLRHWKQDHTRTPCKNPSSAHETVFLKNECRPPWLELSRSLDLSAVRLRRAFKYFARQTSREYWTLRILKVRKSVLYPRSLDPRMCFRTEFDCLRDDWQVFFFKMLKRKVHSFVKGRFQDRKQFFDPDDYLSSEREILHR